ncbi:MAG TPA: NAD(P)H-dependent oxidoreductase subunit E [Thermoanaerobaculia bacterium]|nr:NAD(P)H-dependent oxidoreductase subunit E [Thermoanaerobaculia bacterium]HUM29525.1 NAD(P)H-dependent oxidoreductase subunit E [Thermoanaerobaculia bacterium]HXK67908.1 NAD(P)H-dependent oxidoreductase subunit E [Thermoanaerobaculia bacterium]
MKRHFPPEMESDVQEIFSRYPTREGALLPLLHLAQKTWSYIDRETMDYLAELVGIPPAKVYGVASFYTMYHRKKPGKTHIRVCTNISCMLKGADNLLAALETQLGIRAGETTADGRFSLEEAECLGACDRAPVFMVNDDYEGPVDHLLLAKILSGEPS